MTQPSGCEFYPSRCNIFSIKIYFSIFGSIKPPWHAPQFVFLPNQPCSLLATDERCARQHSIDPRMRLRLPRLSIQELPFLGHACWEKNLMMQELCMLALHVDMYF